jgi:hypothetical protein
MILPEPNNVAAEEELLPSTARVFI